MALVSDRRSLTAKLLIVYVPMVCVSAVAVSLVLEIQYYRTERAALVDGLARLVALQHSALAAAAWECDTDHLPASIRTNRIGQRIEALVAAEDVDRDGVGFQALRSPRERLLDGKPQKALEPIRRDELPARQDPVQLLPHRLGRWRPIIPARIVGPRTRRYSAPRGGVAINPKRLRQIAQSFILRGPSVARGPAISGGPRLG